MQVKGGVATSTLPQGKRKTSEAFNLFINLFTSYYKYRFGGKGERETRGKVFCSLTTFIRKNSLFISVGEEGNMGFKKREIHRCSSFPN